MRIITRLAATGAVLALCLGVLATGTASASATTSAAASGPVETLDAPNWVYNGTAIGIGVMRYWDGSYAMGKYDAVLPSLRFSDLHFGWQETRGVYIGPGYRGQVENVRTGAVTNYGCSLNGHQIHLREGYNYVVHNVSRC